MSQQLSNHPEIRDIQQQFFQALQGMKTGPLRIGVGLGDATRMAHAVFELSCLRISKSDSKNIQTEITRVANLMLIELTKLQNGPAGFMAEHVRLIEEHPLGKYPLGRQIQSSREQLMQMERAYLSYLFFNGGGPEEFLPASTKSPSLFLNSLHEMAGLSGSSADYFKTNFSQLADVFQSPVITLVQSKVLMLSTANKPIHRSDALNDLGKILSSPKTAAIIYQQLSQGDWSTLNYLGSIDVQASAHLRIDQLRAFVTRNDIPVPPRLLAHYFLTQNRADEVPFITSLLFQEVEHRPHNLNPELVTYVEDYRYILEGYAIMDGPNSHVPVLDGNQFTQLPGEPLQPFLEPELPVYSGSLTV